MGCKSPLSDQSLMSCYGSLEDRDVERGVEDGDLACEVAEGRKESLRAVHIVLWIQNMCK